MPLGARLRQLCTALYIDHGSELTLEQLVAVSFLNSLQSLEMGLAEADYMGYLPSCWTRLCHLHSLTLNKCKAVPSVLSTLASLRSLSVRFIFHYPRHCLETLPQLTSLRISLDPAQASMHGPPEFTLVLPNGNDVQLRHLTLKLNTFPQNLQCATHLTQLDMPVGVAMCARQQLHAALYNLKVLNVFEPESDRFRLATRCCWPTVWEHCINLERLSLCGWCVEEIPDCVTKFQQLKSLDMPSAWLRGLKVADLMQLPLLEQLNIGNCTVKLVENFKPAIVDYAYLPVLKQFNFGFQHGFTAHEIDKTSDFWAAVLLQLQAAFVSHKYAPFHLRQWESKKHSDVTVVQFSCDD